MWSGLGYALLAGAMWGLVFVVPLLVPEYPAALLSAGRYLAFGLIALPLGFWDRRALAQLRRADWLMAIELALIGNLFYYLCLAGAIQRAGAPVPTMIIGALPVLIAIVANLRSGDQPRLPWARMAPSLLAIALGVLCVHHAETQTPGTTSGMSLRYLGGLALAGIALLCWTWYPLRNADWLRSHPQVRARSWATAQGLATLPLALLAYALLWLWFMHSGQGFAMPLGPRPLLFVALALAMGLLASWVGTLCWNAASQRLPPAIAGQLIVFETLAALSYAYLLRREWPSSLSLLGVALLLLGVFWTLRSKPPAASG
ncbi:EamA-like transporter family protein [Solimonas aquatica]|uniref:EamA-like transporter family protein n=1 Tax=Solimonas aquatica TaxID=489703 RepID=A0A1H9MIJ8_9GAMM|nr:DMT family transporter [Solimonas aquatica]SER22963.1 EamA-like transporter family protein [Solimonas aquatica]